MDEKQAYASLIITLQRIAKQYGARKQIDDAVYEACVELVTTSFSGLGLEEIEQAYRMWAAGKIDGLEMYGGEFNATQLGRVLASYKAWRAKVVRVYIETKQAHEREQQAKAYAERKRKELHESMPGKIAQAKEQFESWQDVPYHWFRVCWKIGIIRLTKAEQDEYKAQAEKIAQSEKNKELSNLQGLGDIIRYNTLKNAGTTSRADVIAAKLAVWDKLISC